jgi:hypothetical protein
MDKQILPDGADYEASTGYHCLVVELFLHSFILCRENGIAIDDKYQQRLHDMLRYVCAVLRPDGFAALIGDTDSGQVLPIDSHTADDRGYLLPLGAVFFHDSALNLPKQPIPQEVLWILGEQGVSAYEKLPVLTNTISSQAFVSAGTYLLRDKDLFLLFNASGGESPGSGAHRHNDALSIEVSACGRAFIVDPGTYVYTADLRERHRFRSTAYHSTLQIDDIEQNVTNEGVPFVIGDEAHSRAISWELGEKIDSVVAENRGYERLAQPLRHRRKITFHKTERWWLVEDELLGKGEHAIAARFHFDTGLEIKRHSDNCVVACDARSGAQLFVCAIDLQQQVQFETQFSSKHYGSKARSLSATWTVKTKVPITLRWAILPVCPGENEEERLSLFDRV